MEHIHDIKFKIDELIKNGTVKEGGRIRLTHLDRNERMLISECYSGRRDIKCESISVIDAVKPGEEIYSLEIIYLGRRNSNA